MPVGKGLTMSQVLGPLHDQHVIERFWRKVDIIDSPTACWKWTARCDSLGYPRFTAWGGERLPARRVAAVLLYGDIPDLGVVKTTCPTKTCVRHVFILPQHRRPLPRRPNVRRLTIKDRIPEILAAVARGE